jgi:hypothetical protein
MSADDVRSCSGLRLLPATVILLNVDEDPVAQRAVTVEPVERVGAGECCWTEDEVTINWTRLEDPRRSSTALRLTAFARSMLDGTPSTLAKSTPSAMAPMRSSCVRSRPCGLTRRPRSTSCSRRAGAS